MNKKITLFLLTSFFPIASNYIQIDGCKDIAQLPKLYQKKHSGNITENSPEEKELDEQINKLADKKEWCMKMQGTFDEMHSQLDGKTHSHSNYQDNERRLNALADLNTFVSAHLDEYPKNASLVKHRLNIFVLGMQQRQCPWGTVDSECIKSISETMELLNKTLELNAHASNNQTTIESDGEMLADIRKLCQENVHLNWGTIDYITRTVKIGQQVKNDTSK